MAAGVSRDGQVDRPEREIHKLYNARKPSTSCTMELPIETVAQSQEILKSLRGGGQKMSASLGIIPRLRQLPSVDAPVIWCGSSWSSSEKGYGFMRNSSTCQLARFQRIQ